MFKRIALISTFGLLLFSVFAFTGPSETAMACGNNTDDNLLGFIPAWHHYLPCDGDNGIDNVTIELNQIWLIALALFEGILRIGGLVAMIFIIWGGVKYITSTGSPEGTASARKTIINAIAGLIITISASVLVSFVFGLLNGGGGFGQLAPGDNGSGVIANVFSFVYAVIAIVSVMYIVTGAIKFATSTGDPGKAASARNTIIYAIVGLIVVVSASVITSTVLGEVEGSGGGGPSAPSAPSAPPPLTGPGPI